MAQRVMGNDWDEQLNKKPSGMSEFAEQLRPPIVRGEGTTDSERYLAKLGEKTFLNLWSYPNPFRDQMGPGGAVGKELCDLLVVCGPHIIIFSEKNIQWSEKPTEIAWPRWFRKAVWESVDQLRGAERWITSYPNRVFIDPECLVPFPIALPRPPERIIHRIAVARGAGEACRKYFGGGSGSLRINPKIQGTQHFDANPLAIEPFCVGDVDPHGSFVHVLDDTSLDIIMNELDTISDFTSYLQKKETFIRSGRLNLAAGEENLLAYYAIRINDDGDHDFAHPNGGEWIAGESIEINDSHYSKFSSNPQYIAKKKLDKGSYLWDRLIKAFTDNMLGGTSIVLAGYKYELAKSEIGVRHMALASRFERRHHSDAVLGALQNGRKSDTFFRAMISPKGSKNSETGFFFLTYAFHRIFVENGGYDEYREARSATASIYAQAMLMRHPHLKRIVGISTEPPGGKHGSSEDMIYAEQSDWSDETRRKSKADCDRLGIMKPAMKETRVKGEEFPDVGWIELQTSARRFQNHSGDFSSRQENLFSNDSLQQPTSMNRQQRRAAKAVARKACTKPT